MAGYPPKLYSNVDEVGERSINHFSWFKRLSQNKSKIGEDAWEAVKSTSFGVFLKMADMSYVFASSTVRYFLCHQLVVKNTHELWSTINSRPIRFSLNEFTEITGLNCEPCDPADICDSDHHAFWQKMGKADGEAPSLDELDIILSRVKPGKWDLRERMMLCRLCCIHLFICGIHGGSRVPFTLAKRVVDHENFDKYPWGAEAFTHLVDSIKTVDFESSAQTVQGFIHALYIWVFESVPGLGVLVGNRRDVIEGPSLLHWQGSRKRFKFADFITDEIQKYKEVRVRHMIPVPDKLYPIWPDNHLQTDPMLDKLIEDIMNDALVPNQWPVEMNQSQIVLAEKVGGKRKYRESKTMKKAVKARVEVVEGIEGVEGEQGQQGEGVDQGPSKVSGLKEVMELVQSLATSVAKLEENMNNQFTLLQGKIDAVQSDVRVLKEGKGRYTERVDIDLDAESPSWLKYQETCEDNFPSGKPDNVIKTADKVTGEKVTVEKVRVEKLTAEKGTDNQVTGQKVTGDRGTTDKGAGEKHYSADKRTGEKRTAEKRPPPKQNAVKENVGKVSTAVATQKSPGVETRKKNNEERNVTKEKGNGKQNTKNNPPKVAKKNTTDSDFVDDDVVCEKTPKEKALDRFVETFELLTSRVASPDPCGPRGKRVPSLAATQSSPFLGNSTVKRIIVGVGRSEHAYDPMEMVPAEKFQALKDFIEADEREPVGSSNNVVQYFKEMVVPREQWDPHDFGWLRDSHIEEVLLMFRLRSMRPNSPYRERVAFWDPWLMSLWMNDFLDFKTKGKDFLFGESYVEQYMGTQPPNSPINKSWVVDIDNLYGCLNIKKDHWIALDVNFVKRTIYVYDSIPKHSTNDEIVEFCQPFRKMIPAFLKLMSPEKGTYSAAQYTVTRVRQGTPLNERAGDCGVFALKYIECLALGMSFEGLCQSNIQAIRERYGAELFDEIHRGTEVASSNPLPRRSEVNVPQLMDFSYSTS